ncbi:MAG: bifunctional heptose 7-phosphate kinase/heptose 1-phosphate adenyltransferase [Terriglobales bacterium]
MNVELRDCLRRFPRLTITVWGDFVADEFVAGEIARVSREAPVLILKRRRREVAAGGAGNAAANLAALGVRVRLVGAVGADEPGQRLREIFAAWGMDTSRLMTLPGRPTPTKTRILAHHTHTAPQQVVRLDLEPDGLEAGGQARLERAAGAAARGSDAVLISDYGYGAATPAGARRLHQRLGEARPVTVDARYQIGEYRGMAAATPNEAELEAAQRERILDRSGLERAGRRLRERLQCRHLLVTRGRDGMALFEPGRRTRYLAIHGSDQALDVTGAGDTVIAVFTAALAAGADGWSAATLANCAGGVVVMKRGTATLTPAELEAELPRKAEG